MVDHLAFWICAVVLLWVWAGLVNVAWQEARRWRTRRGKAPRPHKALRCRLRLHQWYVDVPAFTVHQLNTGKVMTFCGLCGERRPL